MPQTQTRTEADNRRWNQWLATRPTVTKAIAQTADGHVLCVEVPKVLGHA